MIRYHILAALAGCALDALFGDPRRIPHPVCGIGKSDRMAGSTASQMVPGGREVGEKSGSGDGLLGPAYHGSCRCIDPDSGLCGPSAGRTGGGKRDVRANDGVAFFEKESMKVYDALAAGDVEGARKAVSMIVGRDTASLSDLGITKAAVETVAENTSDGIIAPLFYMVLGGGTGIFLYKAVNTMDSMVGYKNDRYINFGRTAARLDDG